MAVFEFDPSLSPEANIERFYTHLATIEPELTKILKANISRLLPLPAGQERSSARSAVNQAIQDSLMTPGPTDSDAAPESGG